MAIANSGRKQANTGGVKEAAERSAKPKGGRVNLKEQGQAILAGLSEDEQKTLGSKSGNVEFLGLITNPYFTVTRTNRRTGETVKGEETVGALLKNVGEEPITVKTIPNKTFKVMDADFDNVSEREVKPGEEFQVNSIELGELISRYEYASKFTGGGKIVSYTAQSPKEEGTLPTTKLRIEGGSVKDYSVSIADTSEDGKTKVMKDDFKEKFEIFSTRSKGRRSVGGSKKKTNVNEAGLAVQALFNQKLGK